MVSKNARRISMTAVAALGAAGLAAVARAQKRGAFVNVDQRVRRWFRGRRLHGSGVEKALAKVGTYGAKWFSHIPASLFAGAWLSTKSGLPAGATLPAASLASTVLQKGMKKAYGRRRPEKAQRDGKKSRSFPSGHATSSTAIGMTAAYALTRECCAPASVAIPAALGWVALSSASKLYDEHHFFSDILGGLAGGVAIGGAACAAYECTRRRRTDDGPFRGDGGGDDADAPRPRFPAASCNGRATIPRAAGQGLVYAW